MTERRDPYGGDLGDTLAALTGRGKGKRDRSWEQAQREASGVCQVSYRNIPRTLRDRLKEIAKAHQVTVDVVARRLLEGGLERYEAGELAIEQAQDPEPD